MNKYYICDHDFLYECDGIVFASYAEPPPTGCPVLFAKSKAYKQWAKGKPPEFNTMAYLEFKKELDHATRLEF